jgi:hypothetical protein
MLWQLDMQGLLSTCRVGTNHALKGFLNTQVLCKTTGQHHHGPLPHHTQSLRVHVTFLVHFKPSQAAKTTILTDRLPC